MWLVTSDCCLKPFSGTYEPSISVYYKNRSDLRAVRNQGLISRLVPFGRDFPKIEGKSHTDFVYASTKRAFSEAYPIHLVVFSNFAECKANTDTLLGFESAVVNRDAPNKPSGILPYNLQDDRRSTALVFSQVDFQHGGEKSFRMSVNQFGSVSVDFGVKSVYFHACLYRSCFAFRQKEFVTSVCCPSTHKQRQPQEQECPFCLTTHAVSHHSIQSTAQHRSCPHDDGTPTT